MAIPDFQTLMLPALQFASDQEEHASRDAVAFLANRFQVTARERQELLPSGQQTIFDNRANWALTHMRRAELLFTTKRGYFKITERGLQVLSQSPTRIDIRFLTQFAEYRWTRKGGNDQGNGDIEGKAILVTPGEAAIRERTPDELLDQAYEQIRQNLAQELLSQVLTCSPGFFERLVVELLVKMGYGGSRLDAGQAIGKSGDEGIDGIIKEDRLGLDVIYIQAKRWHQTVTRPEIQKFVGALHGQRAHKGIFITTSDFTRDARDYVSKIENKVVLIDGEELARLMIDFTVGVSTVSTYEIKKVDSDYFLEE